MRQGLCNGPVSTCLSHISIAAAACGGFAAGRYAGRLQQAPVVQVQQHRRRSSTAVNSEYQQ